MLYFAACLIVGIGVAQQEPRPPSTTQTPSTANAASAATQVTLPTLTLEEALQKARKQNIELHIATARLEQARVLSRKAWSAYLPQISVGGSYTRNSNEAKLNLPTSNVVRDVGAPTSPVDPALPGAPTTLAVVPTDFVTRVIQPYNSWQGQAQINQALINPTLWPAINNAYISEDIAKLTNDNVQLQMLYSVARAYLGVVGLQEGLKVRQKLHEVSLAHEKDIQLRVEAGAEPRMTLLRIQQDRLLSAKEVTQAENALASAKLALATLLDLDLTADFVAEKPNGIVASNDVAELEKTALSQRPDILAAQRNVELANGLRQATIFAYLPSLGFNGVYRYNNVAGFVGSKDVWALTLGVTWNLFDGGLREAQLSEAASRIIEAQENLRLSQLKARQEVAQSLIDIQNAKSNFANAQERVKLARESQRLIDASFKAGGLTYLDLADADAQLTTAELNAVAEDIEVSLSVLSLLKAAGLFSVQ